MADKTPDPQKGNADNLVAFLLGEEGNRREFLKATGQAAITNLLPLGGRASAALSEAATVVKQCLPPLSPLSPSIIADMITATDDSICVPGTSYYTNYKRGLDNVINKLADVACGKANKETFNKALQNFVTGTCSGIMCAAPISTHFVRIARGHIIKDPRPTDSADASAMKELYDALYLLEQGRGKAYIKLMENELETSTIKLPERIKGSPEIDGYPPSLYFNELSDICSKPMFQSRDEIGISWITDPEKNLRFISEWIDKLSQLKKCGAIAPPEFWWQCEAIDERHHSCLEQIAITLSQGKLKGRDIAIFAHAIANLKDLHAYPDESLDVSTIFHSYGEKYGLQRHIMLEAQRKLIESGAFPLPVNRRSNQAWDAICNTTNNHEIGATIGQTTRAFTAKHMAKFAEPSSAQPRLENRSSDAQEQVQIERKIPEPPSEKKTAPTANRVHYDSGWVDLETSKKRLKGDKPKEK